MLKTLTIRDYVLIDRLEVAFGRGLNILTGETGAGKSIIVGALKMVLGERASTEMVRSGARKAWVEAHFEDVDRPDLVRLLEEQEIDVLPGLILRREIARTQSRAFINDTPATLPVMRQVAAHLIDLHGQHEHQSLLRTDMQRRLLDDFGRLGALVSGYEQRYRKVAELLEQRRQIEGAQAGLQAERQGLAFEIREIDELGPEPEEESRLEEERRRLENAERLFSATASLYEMLYARESSTSDQLVIARNELRGIAGVDRAFDAVLEEIRSAQIAVEEAAAFLQDYNAHIEFSPLRLEEIRRRLGDLDRLKRKYGGTLEAVMNHRARIGARYELAQNYDAAVQQAELATIRAQGELSRAALRLSEKRHEVSDRIEDAIAAELAKLGMPGSRLEVCFERRSDPHGWIRLPVAGQPDARFTAFAHGMDQVAFHISTNVGEVPKLLSKVVSGGEISRIMLALKTILARSDRLPVLVFDEIDRGISGSIAGKVAKSMRALARYHQIVAITHLPQIAALAETHFLVEKHVEGDRSRTGIRRLEQDERAEHVAALFAGAKVTSTTLESARELMERAGT